MSHKKLITGSFARSTSIKPASDAQKMEWMAWQLELGAQFPGQTAIDAAFQADLADVESLFVGR